MTRNANKLVVVASLLVLVSGAQATESSWTAESATVTHQRGATLASDKYMGKYSCAVSTWGGSPGVYCWGNYGTNHLPHLIPGLIDPVAVTVGSYHACALLLDGTARCWASSGTSGNTYGQLGCGTTTSYGFEVVKTVSNLGNLVAIAAGVYHTCAIDAAGLAWCWGSNTNGRLGIGSATGNYSLPVQVPGLGNLVAISALAPTCGLDAAGAAWCWGDNTSGMIGIGNSTTTYFATPQRVSVISNVIDIDVGINHVCAADAAGLAWCWGANVRGQLGTGSSTDSSVPVQVSGLSSITQVSAGREYSCARAATGSVWCWGYNLYYQIDGTRTNRSTPGAAIGSDARNINAGYGTTCGVVYPSGAVSCWGYNFYYQLGNGTTTPTYQLTPAWIPNFGSVMP